MASVRGWVPQDRLPLQSMLVLGTIALTVLALLCGSSLRPGQLLAAMTLHPITATIAGFLLAGAVEEAGGFEATGRILSKMGSGFLGLSGVVVLLVNMPSIFAMPCGRVWAAALIPVAVMMGREIADSRGEPLLVAVIVFGLIVNAAASCGPSPLGGIGMMGEGTAGFTIHAFSNSQQIAIMVITVLAMAGVIWFSRMTGWQVNSRVVRGKQQGKEKLPTRSYTAFFIYMAGLAVIFIVRPAVPIQTILIGLTIAVMLVGRVSLRDLMAGVIIHPVTAMVAGFMMAGALLVSGGFDAMIMLLSWIAHHTPLGYVGSSILLVFLPVIFPLPCGRIIAAALLPGVIMFAQVVAKETGNPQSLPAILVSFILCCAASCAPSPLGGIGGIGEGNLGLKAGTSGRSLQFGILLGIPVAALIVSCLGISGDHLRLGESFAAIAIGCFSGAAINVMLGFNSWKPGGIVGGLLVGALVILV